MIIIWFLILLGENLYSGDTIFIQKDKLYGTAQSIYFETSKNSIFYEQVNNWDLTALDLVSYQSSINFLRKKQLILNKQIPLIPFRKWLSVKQYKGQYYIYKACDLYTNFKVSINDSTFVEYFGDGAIASKIVKQSKTKDNKYEFKLFGFSNKQRTLKIHIIDTQNSIAVFEEIFEDSSHTFNLMISSDKIKNLPMIVNNCQFQKQLELKFDIVNYQLLLNQ